MRDLKIYQLLCNAALPNEGRTAAQRRLGVGSHGTGARHQASDPLTTARLIYIISTPQEMMAAGLAAMPEEPPFAVSWVGAIISVKEFVQIISKSRSIERLVTFSGTISVTGTMQWSQRETDAWICGLLASELVVADQAYQAKIADVKRSRDA